MIEAVVNFVGVWLVDALLTLVFYWPGWVVLRLFTFGRYPPQKTQPHNVFFVAIAGLSVLLAVLTIGLHLSGA